VKFTILPAAELDAADAAVWYNDQRIGLGEEFLEELNGTTRLAEEGQAED
jgi:hypothetical protein